MKRDKLERKKFLHRPLNFLIFVVHIYISSSFQISNKVIKLSLNVPELSMAGGVADWSRRLSADRFSVAASGELKIKYSNYMNIVVYFIRTSQRTKKSSFELNP